MQLVSAVKRKIRRLFPLSWPRGMWELEETMCKTFVRKRFENSRGKPNYQILKFFANVRHTKLVNFSVTILTFLA